MTESRDEDQNSTLNPVDPSTNLKPELSSETVAKTVHPQQTQFEEDSATTKAEKYERHADVQGVDESSSKRIKLDPIAGAEQVDQKLTRSERRKGVAPVKAESVSLRHSVTCVLTYPDSLCTHQVVRATTVLLFQMTMLPKDLII